MPLDEPRSVLVNAPNGSHYLTAEGVAPKSILGIERRQTMVDAIAVTATGDTMSSVVPDAGVAVAIVAVAVENTAMTAAGMVSAIATTQGNALMGIANPSYGTVEQVTPTFNVPAGAAAATTRNILPDGANILLRVGNGSNALWGARATLTSPDTFDVWFYYIALNAQDLSC
jgi:hypothetical protein